MNHLEPMHVWMAQYVTTGTTEPIYHHTPIHARYEEDAKIAAELNRPACEEFVSVVLWDDWRNTNESEELR